MGGVGLAMVVEPANQALNERYHEDLINGIVMEISNKILELSTRIL